MIVAGMGFREAARMESLADAWSKARALAPSMTAIDAVATATEKSENSAFASFVRVLGVRSIGVDAFDLVAQETETQSAASIAARGSGSVAEAAALAAAGSGSRLIVGRTISDDGMATCALAIGGRE